MSDKPQFIPPVRVQSLSDLNLQLALVDHAVTTVNLERTALARSGQLTESLNAEFNAQLRSLKGRRSRLEDRRLVLPANPNQPPLSSDPTLAASPHGSNHSPSVITIAEPTDTSSAMPTTPQQRPRPLVPFHVSPHPGIGADAPEWSSPSMPEAVLPTSLEPPRPSKRRRVQDPRPVTALDQARSRLSPSTPPRSAQPDVLVIEDEGSSPLGSRDQFSPPSRRVPPHHYYSPPSHPVGLSPYINLAQPNTLPRPNPIRSADASRDAYGTTTPPRLHRSALASPSCVQVIDLTADSHATIQSHAGLGYRPLLPVYPQARSQLPTMGPGAPMGLSTQQLRSAMGQVIGTLNPQRSTARANQLRSEMATFANLLDPRQGYTMTPADPQAESELASREQDRGELRGLVMGIHKLRINLNQRLATPPNMNVMLKEYQKVGLAWMVNMENSFVCGGILADDMGLGKTVQSIALLLTHRPRKPTKIVEAADGVMVNQTSPDITPTTLGTPQIPNTIRHHYATLVVAPPSLIYQWKREIQTKIGNRKLAVYVYHGANRERRPELLSHYDVVVTTYSLLGHGYPRPTEDDAESNDAPAVCPLFQIKWWRVILDEAQIIKNRLSKVSIAVTHLESKHRWCLSGTLIQNSIDELYPSMRFLQIKPLDKWDRFRQEISSPFSHEHYAESAMQRVQWLLKSLSLRRRKQDTLDGQPILCLPEKQALLDQVVFSDPEVLFYQSIEKRTQKDFKELVERNAVMDNYGHILLLILRLRQACCHPHLAVDSRHRDILEDYDHEVKKYPDSAWDLHVPTPSTGTKAETTPTPTMDWSPTHSLRSVGNESKVDVVSLENTAVADNAMSIDTKPRVSGPDPALPKDSVDLPLVTDLLISPRKSEPLTANTTGQQTQGAARPQVPCKTWTTRQKTVWKKLPTELQRSLALVDFTTVQCQYCLDVVADPVITSPCGHIFCEECLDTHLNSQVDDVEPNCPRCRTKLRPKQALVVTVDPNEAEVVADLGLPPPNGTQALLEQAKDSSSNGKKPSALRGPSRKVRKIRPHPIKEFVPERYKFVPSAKIRRALQVIHDTKRNHPSDKFVIFSQFTKMLFLMSKALNQYNVRHFIYDGSMTAMEREEMVKNFEDDAEVTIMLISIKCGSVGLNLCCANRVILLDLWWNPALEDQATDRVYRIGQTKNVTVHRIVVPNTIEDRILALQERKRQIVEQAYGEGGNERLGRLSFNDLAYLFNAGSCS
ncbi:hypothetical protein H4R34_001712 [Dimargaris verticillata]|uniref:SNF2 family N-terminal domain-containing protein n=1 Tax=Dimargaris verticillata TaxID=2761393 RepID=A0A9W8BA80_9FUNG|nr:hypothetical protein H4R34_001712 [Dimargaris verticillata]